MAGGELRRRDGRKTNGRSMTWVDGHVPGNLNDEQKLEQFSVWDRELSLIGQVYII